jgi:hypothetical protein
VHDAPLRQNLEELELIGISQYSAAAVPIELYFNKTKLSVATAFFWQPIKKSYLVTNWHNVTGINPITGKHLNPTAAEPDTIQVDIFVDRDPNKRGSRSIHLYDERGEPVWFEHPIYGKNVDVVCIPLTASFSKNCLPINKLAKPNWSIDIGSDVFVLGFPLGIGPSRLPIWKRASIATEPAVNVDDLPLVYVDTLTARGMSGSPVIMYKMQGSDASGNYSIMNSFSGCFVGVYSGRMMAGSSVDAQLGRVWKAQVIDEIIAGMRRGKIR